MTKTTLRDIIENKVEATTLSQMLVITRVQELKAEMDRLIEEAQHNLARQQQIKAIVPELLALFDDMPDEGAQPLPFGEAVS